MWLGLFQPLLHDRVLDDLSAAARNSALDDHYAVSALARRWRWPCFLSNAAHSYARHTSPLASPRKAVHTRSRGLHTRKESSFDRKPRVTGRLISCCEITARTWHYRPSGNYLCQRFSHVLIRPDRANAPSFV